MRSRVASIRSRRARTGCLALAVVVLVIVLAALRVGRVLLPREGGEGAARPKVDAPGGAKEESLSVPAEDAALGEGALEYTSERDLAGEATLVLEAYRAKEGCLLMRAGYLDLLGNVWSCVVTGDDWVDLCVVRSREDGGSSVRVVRLEADAWKEDLQ